MQDQRNRGHLTKQFVICRIQFPIHTLTLKIITLFAYISMHINNDYNTSFKGESYVKSRGFYYNP